MPITFTRRVLCSRDRYWRQFFWSRWGFLPPPVVRAIRRRPVLLIDALSGGEITQLPSFCASLRRALPAWYLIVSTNNRYSFDFAAANLDVDAVIDSPWDCPGPVRRLLRALKPAAVVSVQNLHCPVLLEEAHRAGTKTAIVSALWSCSIDQHPMSRRAIERKPFRFIDRIGAWSDEDARNLVASGVPADRVEVTGNMKFDFGFLEVSEADRMQLRAALRIRPDEPILLAGSLHPGEDRLVADAYLLARRRVPALRLVIVPRYAFHIPAMVRTLDDRSLPHTLRSAVGSVSGAPAPVILVDTFGELGKLYAIASAIFLGGTTYARNALALGQNPVEPLVQRRPLFFGPYMKLWTSLTSRLKAACPEVEVTAAEALASGVGLALTDDEFQRRFAHAAEGVLRDHLDDVERNVALVLETIGMPAAGALAEACASR